MKKAMFAFVAILAVVCMASSAFAAAALNAGNSSVAVERIDSTANSFTNFAPGVVNAFQPGGLVGAGTTIRVALTNAVFTAADTISLCRGTTVVGSGTVAAAPNNGRVDILTSAPLNNADILVFDNAGCVAPILPLNDVNLPASLAVGAVVTMTTDNPAAAGDPNLAATATIATVKQQFSATLAPVTSKLDFTTNMRNFISQGTSAPANPPRTPSATASQAAVTILSDESIAFRVNVIAGGGACQRTLAAAGAGQATVTVTGDLTGLSNITYDAAPAAAIVAADVTAASKTFNLTGTDLKICFSGGATPDSPVAPTALQLTAGGADTIIAGTRNTAITLKGNGLNTFLNQNVRTLVATTPSHLIQLDAASAIIPFLSTNPTVKTNCVISNTSSTLTGTVTFTVTAKDGGGVLPGTLTLGTIGPKTTVNVIFDTNNVTLGANPPVVLGLGANVRYSGNIAVSAPPSGLSFNCLQTDPVAGPKRLVPVLQANGTNMPVF